MRWFSAILTIFVAACSMAETTPTGATTVATTTSPTVVATTEATTTNTLPSTTTTTQPDPYARPPWLGTRPLPLRDDGFGEVLPTPPELEDRAFATPDALAPPATEDFVGTVGPVPDDVLARSTWSESCPVSRDDLAYLTVTHWGFDGAVHTGELLIAAAHGEAVVGAFEALYAAHFPIEEMRIIRSDELDLPPTGDGNVTTGFVCRPVVGSDSWSMHALGEAIDINPFHNPYVRGDLVLPELASTYTDRTDRRDGMIFEADAVVSAFDAIGWQWGGRWTTLTDPMHFSTNGR